MKTTVKTIIGTCAFTLFFASASFAQDTAPLEDTRNNDQTYPGTETTQDTKAQEGIEAQDNNNSNTQPQLGQNAQQGDENKTQIAQEELPSEVSTSIEEGQYAEWTVAEAYEVDKKGEKMYELHFETPEGEIKKETFNKNGQVAR